MDQHAQFVRSKECLESRSKFVKMFHHHSECSQRIRADTWAPRAQAPFHDCQIAISELLQHADHDQSSEAEYWLRTSEKTKNHRFVFRNLSRKAPQEGLQRPRQ